MGIKEMHIFTATFFFLYLAQVQTTDDSDESALSSDLVAVTLLFPFLFVFFLVIQLCNLEKNVVHYYKIPSKVEDDKAIES